MVEKNHKQEERVYTNLAHHMQILMVIMPVTRITCCGRYAASEKIQNASWKRVWTTTMMKKFEEL
jgi:hypothetical protein